MSVAETGLWLGTGTGVISGLGGMACGFVVDKVYAKSGQDPAMWFRMITLGQLLYCPIFILAISVHHKYLALFLTSFATVPQGLVGPSQNTAQMFVVPQELRATTTGMAEVCWTGANAVGPLVGGILSDLLGDRTESSLGKQQERALHNSVLWVRLLMLLELCVRGAPIQKKTTLD